MTGVGGGGGGTGQRTRKIAGREEGKARAGWILPRAPAGPRAGVVALTRC